MKQPIRKCLVAECEVYRSYLWKGYCHPHYYKLLKYGDPRAGKYGKHGLTRSAEHHVWKGIKARCNNPNNPGYNNYGARGIKLCERWLTFANFFEDMGTRPSPAHSIERINNDRGYEPGNCKWATRIEQNRNSRQNVKLTHNGQTMTAAEWADRLGIKHTTLYGRIRKGFPIEAALSTRDRRFHARKGERSF
jgi:hypothetical protein